MTKHVLVRESLETDVSRSNEDQTLENVERLGDCETGRDVTVKRDSLDKAC